MGHMKASAIEMPQDLNATRLAWRSLALLLLINLFNYVDRQILAAVEKPISEELSLSKTQTGQLYSAFLISYMLLSPLFGVLGDRMRRWAIIGIGVLMWSLASGGSGLANTYLFLLGMRCLIGVGEAAYGPVAPTIISDLFPVKARGKVMAAFYAAIPVGSACGYAIGGFFSDHWHRAFFSTLPPGIILGLLCFFMPEPKRVGSPDAAPHKPRAADYLALVKIPSYVLNTLAMAALTFSMGGIAFWMPRYLVEDRHLNPEHANLIFGGIVATAGLIATVAGGWAGDKLRDKVRGGYFIVSAAGMLSGFPLFLLMLVTPFPACWGVIFLACCCLFFNTGPSNTALANVTHPSIRATAFAANILVIHTLGDVISPTIIGAVADRFKTPDSSGLSIGFVVVSGLMLLGGILWAWGARYLDRDTQQAEEPSESAGVPVN
jgi:MFS family permease